MLVDNFIVCHFLINVPVLYLVQCLSPDILIIDINIHSKSEDALGNKIPDHVIFSFSVLEILVFQQLVATNMDTRLPVYMVLQCYIALVFHAISTDKPTCLHKQNHRPWLKRYNPFETISCFAGGLHLI